MDKFKMWEKLKFNALFHGDDWKNSKMYNDLEEKFKNFDKPITIATMGCAVNGPGEAKHADFGIAGGINEGYVFKKGEIVAKVPEDKLIEKLEEIITKSYK